MLRHTTEYGEASSDDLSSEWESSNENEASASKSGGSGQKSDQSSQIVTLKEPLATNLAMNVARRRKMMPISKNTEDEDEFDSTHNGTFDEFYYLFEIRI